MVRTLERPSCHEHWLPWQTPKTEGRKPRRNKGPLCNRVENHSTRLTIMWPWKEKLKEPTMVKTMVTEERPTPRSKTSPQNNIHICINKTVLKRWSAIGGSRTIVNVGSDVWSTTAIAPRRDIIIATSPMVLLQLPNRRLFGHHQGVWEADDLDLLSRLMRSLKSRCFLAARIFLDMLPNISSDVMSGEGRASMRKF